MLIKGIPVILYERTPNGKDAFGTEIYTETPVTVQNVIVSPATADEIVNDLNLYGKETVYKLGIPKGDTHNWDNSKIEFFGKVFQSFGASTFGIEAMVPSDWHRIVKVYLYE